MKRKYALKNSRTRKKCSVCEKPAKGLGFCGKHYQNFKRLGKPEANQNSINSLEDFIKKVKELPIDEKGCKNWNRGLDKEGYGYYAIKGVTYRCSRLIYITTFPGNYDELVVRHKCDNRSCCHIDHLEIGTPKDNSNDMISRGRHLTGSKVGTSKLTENEAVEIREKYPSKNIIELAKEYGVCKQTISNVINRKTFINAYQVNEQCPHDLNNKNKSHE